MVARLHIVPPLGRYGIDREGGVRGQADLFDRLLADSRTVVLPFHDGLAPVRDARLVLLPPSEVTSAQIRVYLGRTTSASANEPEGAPILLEVLSDAAFRDLSIENAQWLSLRECGGELSSRDAGLYAEALALANWHDTHRFCPRCGEPTVMFEGGWARRCFADEYVVYPRMDPAVIMAVRDHDDRLLLGGGRENWYSVLAGFVEPGESLEAAVVREVREEANLGVAVDDYLGSQSWPFPASLMLAFGAVVTDTDPDTALRPDGAEIDHLEFFSRSEFAKRAPTMRLPGRASIARALIEAWYGGPFQALDEPVPIASAEGGFVAGTDIPEAGA